MSQDKHKTNSEDYLESDSPLSTSYQRASSEQVPAHLDDAILAASRRALQSRPRYAFSPFASDWYLPLSLAAVVVLSLTVVLTVQKESDEDYPTIPVQYEPIAVSRTAADDFSDSSSEMESWLMKNRTDEKKDVLKTVVDSVGIRHKMESAGKSKESRREENGARPSRQSMEPMFEMPSVALPERQSYAPEPSDIPLSFERKSVIELNEKEIQNKFQQEESKQTGIKRRSESVAAFDISEGLQSKKNVRSKQLKENTQDAPLQITGGIQKTPEDWLVLIQQLWTDGYIDEAVQELKRFYKQHSGYQQEKIKQQLDQKLINEVKVGY